MVLAHAAVTAIFGHQRWLDPVFHFLGGAAVFYTIDRLLRLFAGVRRPKLALALVVVPVLLWELVEFLSDRYLGTLVQQGALDTGSDVVLGLGGAVVGFLVFCSSR